MAKQTGRTKECSAAMRRGRMRKAREFLELAELAGPELPDGCVSNAVLAGIAAADVICCVRSGVRAAGEDHQRAVVLLKQADARSAPHLDRLIRLKSRSAYSDLPATTKQASTALRDATALVTFAESLV